MNTRRVVLLLLNIAVCAALLVGSFYIVFSVHYWAWPRVAGPNVNVMSLTGYTMGGPFLLSILLAIAASFIPRFRRLPGRFFLAWGVLLFCISGFNAYRIYAGVKSSAPQAEASPE
jgi:hypothetical protein